MSSLPNSEEIMARLKAHVLDRPTHPGVALASFPNTEKVVSLFKAHLLDHPTNVPSSAPFYLALPTVSLEMKIGYLPISPKFETREELESFCGQHHGDYFALENQIRELGTVPRMFWEKS